MLPGVFYFRILRCGIMLGYSLLRNRMTTWYMFFCQSHSLDNTEGTVICSLDLSTISNGMAGMIYVAGLSSGSEQGASRISEASYFKRPWHSPRA